MSSIAVSVLFYQIQSSIHSNQFIFATDYPRVHNQKNRPSKNQNSSSNVVLLLFTRTLSQRGQSSARSSRQKKSSPHHFQQKHTHSRLSFNLIRLHTYTCLPTSITRSFIKIQQKCGEFFTDLYFF